MNSNSYGQGPVDVSRARTKIIQLIWNRASPCCICMDRTEPADKNHRNRMVYRHEHGEEFLYCIPCAAIVFGMDQRSLVQSLNLEAVFHDKACAARVSKRISQYGTPTTHS